MHAGLKTAAVLCKVFAAIEWLVLGLPMILLHIARMEATEPPREAPQDWGTPAYYYRTCLLIFIVFIIVLVAVVPNRWLVRSKIIFVASLLVALLPLGQIVAGMVRDVLYDPFFSRRHLLDPFGWAMTIVICIPLPLSLVLSFWQTRSDEEVVR